MAIFTNITIFSVGLMFMGMSLLGFYKPKR